MASVDNVELEKQTERTRPVVVPDETSLGSAVHTVLRPLASLKLTVVLFALAIFIVFAGTLAQVDHDIWRVIHDYFRIDFTRVWQSSFPWINLGAFFAWIDFKIFFPPSFFPKDPNLPRMLEFLRPIWPGNLNFPWWFGIYFPKGWTIGAVMMLNLFAAHAVRFKMQAVGRRLILGWSTIAFGCLVTALVVMSGSNSEGLQHESWLSYDILWRVMQLSLLGLFGLSTVWAFNTPEQQRNVRWLLGGAAGLLAAVQIGTFLAGPFDDSAMRILYQVIKATLAACILLVGCVMVFRKRAGIVLLHGGIGLMMVFDVLVGTAHVESRMLIEEGQTVRYSEDMRTSELAVVDRSDPDQDWHTVVDARQLSKDAVIADEQLPFKVRVVEYFPNSTVLPLDQIRKENPDFTNLATKGLGQRFGAVNLAQSTGTDTSARIDTPSAYVELLDAKSDESLGTYLINVLRTDQPVEVDGKSYDLSLRFKRLYKPYEVTLVDVQKNDYTGTKNVRDYRSILKIADDSRTSSFEYPVWMNNPLRYGGETFYQSEFYRAGDLGRDAKEATGLQVVSNTGWMIPYVSCMIVAVGMLAQFTLTLLRFLQRRLQAFDQMRSLESPDGSGQGPAGRKGTPATVEPRGRFWRGWLVPLAVGGVTALFIAVWAMPRSTPEDQMDFTSFGKLPVLYQGRAQPFDSLARNALIAISDKQSFKYDTMDRSERSKPATQWLLDVMAHPEQAAKDQVFRIESVDVVDLLGLERRPGSWRYSFGEFEEKWNEILPQVAAAFDAGQAAQNDKSKQVSLLDRKLIDLGQKVQLYKKLQTAFLELGALTPELPALDQINSNDPVAEQRKLELRNFLENARTEISGMGLPLSVPFHLDRQDRTLSAAFGGDWLPYPLASVYATLDARVGFEPPPAYRAVQAILKAYADGDATAFNKAVDEYRELLASAPEKDLTPADLAATVSLSKSDFEAEFNRIGGFNLASWIYLAAFVLAALSWLGWTRSLNRAAFCIIAVTFVLHTLALIGRIYISGRPPVTNLYSSAVFIGWAGVLFGLGLEAVYRLGIGNVIAAVSGFLTLRIANGLAMDGDTFGVLEAVLDTQFWLATHVVCVTLGYAASYVSALLGLVTIGRGVLTRSLSDDDERTLTRMNYGVLCFAIFFSFVGTVLGGLWADDSWGRFWGWDPKENGALIIVLWNALVLHARWDGMIKARGLAVLTTLGGIVVSWSWFGVNELNVGLHSYGFTEGRLAKLGAACLAFAFVAAMGCVPRSWWRSRGGNSSNRNSATVLTS